MTLATIQDFPARQFEVRGLEFIAQARDQVADWLQRLDDQQLQPLVLLTSEWLTNLVRHSDRAPTRLVMKLSRDSAGWQLTLVDDGAAFAGFAQLFAQADTGFDDLRTSGMGLGLIKSLADEVSYSSDVDGNTLRLCIHHAQAPVAVRQRVVLIDDDVTLLMLMVAYLEPEFDVQSFSDPEQALNWIGQHSADLIISDVNMPGIDGINLRAQLHRMTPSLPFVFLTGESADTLYQLPIDDVLHKPVDKHRLLATVQRVLSHQQRLVEAIGEQLQPHIVRQLAPQIHHQPDGMTLLLASRNAGGGGDLFFQVQHDKTDVLVLADVMGHDAQARFFVHAFHGYLYGLSKAWLTSEAPDPGSLLATIAQGMAHDALLGSTLLTALVLCLEPAPAGQEVAQLTFASAGHLPLQQLREGCWQPLAAATGPLLGFGCGDFPQTRIALEQPLLLLTDGFPEALTADQQVEFYRLLANGVQQPAPSVAEAMDYYDKCVGYQPPDDATLVVIIPDGWRDRN